MSCINKARKIETLLSNTCGKVDVNSECNGNDGSSNSIIS